MLLFIFLFLMPYSVVVLKVSGTFLNCEGVGLYKLQSACEWHFEVFKQLN